MELITTPFTRDSTAFEVLEGVDLSGRKAIVTGGSSGIGFETARALSHAGADVTIAVRDIEAGARAARDILASSGNTSIAVAQLDLTDFTSIRSFTSAWFGPLHMLVNNAGVMAVPDLELSFDGHEIQFATNHLGHFALTAWMHHSLAAAEGARVVSVSSNAHHFSPVDVSRCRLRGRPYDPWTAYGQSKTANILTPSRSRGAGVTTALRRTRCTPAPFPTNLQRHVGGMQTPVELRKSPEQGAATVVLLAASPLLDDVGGRYFEDCHEAEVTDAPELFGGGVNPVGARSRECGETLGALAPHA